MSAAKNGKSKKKDAPKEPKALTASQLFDRYMKAAARAAKLANKLKVELLEAERLSTELAERFGVHVGKKPPARKTQPVAREEPLRNEGDADAEGAEVDYKPPPQTRTADAPRLSAKESQDVADIRRDSGLSAEEAADAEALEASGGPGKLAELHSAMGGKPVIPSPGAVEGVPDEEPDPGPDNQGGGPVTQKPVPEKE